MNTHDEADRTGVDSDVEREAAPAAEASEVPPAAVEIRRPGGPDLGLAEVLWTVRASEGMTMESFVGRLARLGKLDRPAAERMIRQIEGGEIKPTPSYMRALGLEKWSVNPGVDMRRLAESDPDWYRVMGVILHGFSDGTVADAFERAASAGGSGGAGGRDVKMPVGGYTADQVLGALRLMPHIDRDLAEEPAPPEPQSETGTIVVPRVVKLPNGFWDWVDALRVGDKRTVVGIAMTKLNGNIYRRPGKRWKIRCVDGSSLRGTYTVERIE